MSTPYLKRYTDPETRQRARSNYDWLAGLEPIILPRILPTSGGEGLCFEHVDGRHALPEDLPDLAGHLGALHGAAYTRDLHHARLPEPYRTSAGHTLPGFPERRADAVVRELRAGRAPGARLSAHEARRLIMSADGPAAFYKDANPRNVILTPDGAPVTIDFDELTLAPFGYDLAKLVVTLAMTYGRIPAPAIAAALTSYNTATARHCPALPGIAWDELMNWAEIHHILTGPYAADGRYPHRWDHARPSARPAGDGAWP